MDFYDNREHYQKKSWMNRYKNEIFSVPAYLNK